MQRHFIHVITAAACYDDGTLKKKKNKNVEENAIYLFFKSRKRAINLLSIPGEML